MSALSVGVVGLSHLGIVSSVGCASLGFPVVAVGSAEETVRRLQRGDCIVPEPYLPECLAAHSAALTFTTDFSALAACGVVLIAEDTRITQENAMDLHRVRALIDAMIPHLRPGVTILLMSQVPVGFTRALHRTLRERRANIPFHLYYWVEPLVIGDALQRFLQPERIVVGSSAATEQLSGDALCVFHSFPSCPLLTMDYESAELTKSAVNVYLATTVTFANALADLCEAVGADMTQIIPALRLDKRIGPSAYIQPGLGFSGGHLERDLVALSRLARTHGVRTAFLDCIQEESAHRYRWLTENIESAIMAKQSSPTIALWGLSYKKNTDSMHGAPSLKVMRDFAGRARLIVYDPVVRLPVDSSVRTVGDRYEALDGADGLVVLSDWDVFRDCDVARLKGAMRTPLVIDPFHVLGAVDFVQEGMQYVTMGRERT